MNGKTPFFRDVQAHYDLSDEFFALFLDPTKTYSCAYFERDDYTLEQAQLAKIDLALDKLDLRPGMTLLDIGCGWGATMRRALERFDIEVIGLTLSRNQYDYVKESVKGERSDVRLQGWEEFNGKVDRIVSIGAFEHFRYARYASFFDFAVSALPPDGRMLLHTIVLYPRDELAERGVRYTHDFFVFLRFLGEVIFPGGQLPFPRDVRRCSEDAGLTVERIQALRPHYARTLDEWATSLQSRRDEAIALCGEQTSNTYMRYLTGCADLFRTGHTDVMQFTLVKKN